MSYKILKTWLKKCNDLRKLDFNPEIEIKTKLLYVKHYNPISIKVLKNMLNIIILFQLSY